ncbi:MAG: hypothetical protein RL220_1538 [Bacteroidota bacterium]|jgi:hypothetical protein
MNWGWKMALVYTGFVGFMLSFVFIARKEKIELVTPDYYAEEIRFKERMDAMRNAQETESKPSISIRGNDIEINYPDTFDVTEGLIKLYCPHDAASDQLIPVQIDQSRQQVIPGSTLKHGQYSVSIIWNAAGKSFYHEQTVSVP